jgi:hypothetical protein
VRAELYRAFDALEEVLEQDLDPQERDALEERLRYVAAHAGRPDLTRLANDLLVFLRFESLELAPHRPGLTARWVERWQAFEQTWLSRQRMKFMLAGGLMGLGVVTLAKTTLAVFFIALVNMAGSPAAETPGAVAALVRDLVAAWDLSVPRGLFRYTDLALESGVSLLLLLASGLLATGRDRSGTDLGWVGLLLSLTAVNLLVFYYDQFSSILLALIQLVLLAGLTAYRQRFLREPPALAEAEADLPPAPLPEGQEETGPTPPTAHG